jgi:hypothetical protein
VLSCVRDSSRAAVAVVGVSSGASARRRGVRVRRRVLQALEGATRRAAGRLPYLPARSTCPPGDQVKGIRGNSGVSRMASRTCSISAHDPTDPDGHPGHRGPPCQPRVVSNDRRPANVEHTGGATPFRDTSRVRRPPQEAVVTPPAPASRRLHLAAAILFGIAARLPPRGPARARRRAARPELRPRRSAGRRAGWRLGRRAHHLHRARRTRHLPAALRHGQRKASTGSSTAARK